MIYLVGSLTAQDPTVGLLLNGDLSEEGYSLFCPNTSVYLIDNCGYLVNKWDSEFRPGLSVYLDNEGNIFRAGNKSGSINAAGGGGIIEKISWDNELLWQYNYNTDNARQHHDIEVMPNGNILLLAWEVKTRDEAIASGRDSLTIASTLYPEHIVEVKPIGQDQGEIVWEWHAWDHLIQDFDETKDNYGTVSEHPELIDVNFGSGFSELGGNQDWMHANAVAYNPRRDEIAISVRNFSEILIIDHSTTTEEAAGHSGGNRNKGGDILYRYGNPMTYQRGEIEDQVFFNQHSISWIPDDYHDGGKMMVFNNGNTRPDGPYSSVDIFEPPIDINENYVLDEEGSYGPQSPEWSYNGDNLYSPIMSSAQAMPEGNILICEGASGKFLEINRSKEVVWRYQNPVAFSGPVTQGSNNSFTTVFRIERYFDDFAGLTDKILEATEPIELEPLDYSCQIDGGTVASDDIYIPSDLVLRSNPIIEKLIIDNNMNQSYYLKLVDLSGKSVFSSTIVQGENQYLLDIPGGLYIAIAYDNAGRVVYSEKIIHL